MTTDQSRLRQQFASVFGIDTRALAALRIALGLLILADLVTRLRDLTLLYTNDGLLPRWLAVGVHALSGWSFHAFAASPAATLALFALAGLAAGMLLVGYRTRLATVASWALLGSLHLRNPYVLDGGDYVLRVLLFWSMFVPLNRCWSVDAGRGATGPAPSRTIVSAGTAAILLQVGFIYFFAGAEKMLGSEWRDGTAVYLVASHQYWARPLGTWVAAWPGLLQQTITYAVLALELVGSLLLFSPIRTTRVRMFAVSMFALFHLATGLSIELGLFPFITSAGLLLFVPSSWWNRFAVLRLPSQPPPPPSRDAVRSPWRRRVPTGLMAVAVAFTFVANAEYLRAHWIFPDRVREGAAVLGLGQGWGMYAPSPYNEGFRLEIRATSVDGTEQRLDGGGTGDSWPPVARMRDGYRAKIYLEWIATGGWDMAVHRFADWVCREARLMGPPPEPVRSVRVVKLVGDSPAIPATATREVTLSSMACDPG